MATNPDALGIPFGRYHLLERLGRGGMAEVWQAKALGPMGYARKLVVKRILPELVRDDEFVSMFAAEARLSASLNHRNIVQVYEFGDVDGEYYLAMEWVHGRNLATLLRARVAERHEPCVGLGAYAAREVCRALAYAHALTDDDGRPLGLIHRDVSPSNVMLGFDGSVKLLDFGIAKAMAIASENRTQAGVLKGKLGYLSPEQIEGAAVDRRADLFVTGILLWEMLTLRRLFKGASDIQTLALVRDARVPPPSTINPAVPPELDAVCMRALMRRPDERFADCGAMAAALDEVVHALKFGSEDAARLMRQTFPDAREPTQPLTTVPLAPPTTPPPSGPCTPTPAGELADGPTTLTPVPSAAARLRAAIARLTAPPVRAWQTRERRRLVSMATASLLAGAGLVIATHRAPPPRVVVVNAATPAPAPPPAPAFVHVTLATRPAGATVQLAGDPEPRGTTPIELTLARASAPRQIWLTAPGYERASVDVMPDVDSRLYFELARAGHVLRRRAARATPPTVPPPEAPPPEAPPPPSRVGIRGLP